MRGCRRRHEQRHPALPRTSLGQCLRSGNIWGLCYFQVFDDMQRELVLMTKPKHRNVLMVHGMYALGALGSQAGRPGRPV